MLYWVLVCFKVQFNMLMIIFKTLHGMGPSYQMNSLIPIISVFPTQSGRKGKFQTLTAKEFQLAGTRKRPFSTTVPVLWNIVPRGEGSSHLSGLVEDS